jgi:hypothetical protein
MKGRFDAERMLKSETCDVFQAKSLAFQRTMFSWGKNPFEGKISRC